MWPFHWALGPLAITPNELFAVLGTVMGAWVVGRRLMALGSTRGGIVDFILCALAGGAVGSRLFYFIPLWLRGAIGTGTLVSSWADGSGFYGGFIGGAIGIALAARFKKMPVLPSVDAAAATVPLGFAVGKIGCFLAGCCYGRPSPHGLSFAKGSLCFSAQRKDGMIPESAASSLPVVPIQLIDMAFGFAFFAALMLLLKRSKRPGEVTVASFAGYSVYRFIIEFFRDDPGRRNFGSSTLSDSQIMALAVLVLAAAAALVLRRRKQAAETTPAAPK